MPRTRDYQHFCPVARSLEVIGEKWSLLVVRDLLRGPQRFTDLLRYMGGITPKWLTARLRDLEAAGIVERDSEEGRREVWYRLTARGRELGPVVASLAVWGMDHALRAPLPGEPIFPEQTLTALAVYMNTKGTGLDGPVVWEFHFPDRPAIHLSYESNRWRTRTPDADATLVINTTPSAWTAVFVANGAERKRLLDRLDVSGPAGRIAEFRDVMVAAPTSASPPKRLADAQSPPKRVAPSRAPTRRAASRPPLAKRRVAAQLR